MHFMPLTDGKGSRAGTRSAGGRSCDKEPLSTTGRVCREACLAWSMGADANADMSGLGAGAGELESESLRRDEGAVADGRSELLNMDDAELACELADPTVLGISAVGDALSSAGG